MFAIVTGTLQRPVIQLRFAYAARIPSGVLVREWVKTLPGRSWDAEQRLWEVTEPGPHPWATFEAAGFTVDTWDAPAPLHELYTPLVELTGPHTVTIHPRFAGPTAVAAHLAGAPVWNSATGAFTASVGALTGWGLPLPNDVTAALAAHAPESGLDPGVVEAAGRLALAADETGIETLVDHVAAAVGDAPGWFGAGEITLRPYQRLGALAAAAGRTLIADEMGLGKSFTALATAAIHRAERLIIACPPVAVSNWIREAERSHLADHMGDEGAAVVAIRAGRKEPALPETGIVVITDSLLASRPATARRLTEWGADLLVYDEAHRAKTWDSQRATAMRTLALSCRRRLALTGTPMLSSPAELAPILAIIGHLDPVFGGHARFMDTYTRRNHFNAIVPRTRALPGLAELIRAHVWVRRLKSQVLTELPAKQRHTLLLDVPLTAYRAAHTEVAEKIAAHLDQQLQQTGQLPDRETMAAWCRSQIGLTSIMRKAAGLAKVPAAVEHIDEWTSATENRPLIVWGIHHAVLDALADHLTAKSIRFERIDGSTPHTARDLITVAFQAGEVPVLLANIVAAGVAITLTRGADALFVETEWRPGLVSQSEDRLHRLGQTRPVEITTLVAQGTLDELIHQVLRRNIETLDVIMTGGDHHVATHDDTLASRSVGTLVWAIAKPVWEQYAEGPTPCTT